MRIISSALCSALALAAFGACDLEIGDLNNPSLDELQDNPTAASIAAASAGLMSGHRAGMAAANGYISLLGILGRESYNFDTADPRYCGEMLAGELAKGSPFGGAFWGGPYANIRQANIIIKGVDKIAAYSAEQRAAVKGYARTFIAMDLLRVAVTRDTIGGVVDTDRPVDGPLAPIAEKADMFATIASTLDQAKTDLMAGGMAFPFALPSGFAGFNTPANFLKVNRAIRARAALYDGKYADALAALGESFFNETAATIADLNAGPTMVFSANAGDARNLLTSVNIWAHPDLVTDAQLQTNNMPDKRLTDKTAVPTSAPTMGTNCGLSSNRRFRMYSAATSPVPLIRNEELFLIRAEARLKTGQKDAAVADLNKLRQIAGSLAAKDPAAMTDADVETELLYNRRYSLMFEGGHRWIDSRRLRVSELKAALPNHGINVRFPIPQGECDARPGEAKCAIGSR